MSVSRGMSALALGGVALLALTGCVGGQVDQEDIPAGDESGDADARMLRLGHVYEASHAFERCGIAAVQDALEGSGIQIESYPASQIGTEAEMLEQVQSGSLDAVMAGAAFLGTWYDDAAVLDAPYSVLESFSDDERAAWDAALEAGATAAKECVIEDEEEIVDKWAEEGTVEVVEDVDTAAFAEAVRSQLPDQVSFGDLYTKIVKSQQ